MVLESMLAMLQALGYAEAAPRCYTKHLPRARARGYSGGTVLVVQLHTRGYGHHSATHLLVTADGTRHPATQPPTPFSGLQGMVHALEHELTRCGQLGFKHLL